MDASLLRALLAKVMKLEDELKIQPNLELARDSITNMANSPQDPSFQTAFANAFKELKSSIILISDALTPSEWDGLEEIKSKDDFSDEIIVEIEKLVSENAATPAVIRDGIIEISDKRKNEINHYRALLKELVYFGFSIELNQIHQGQLGFKIPRDLFDNNFSELIGELSFIRRFVRLIAEACDENPDDIRVGVISTTDPLFWLIVTFGVAKSVGSVTGWCLDTWKKVEDIRKVRAEMSNLKSFSVKEIEAIFNPKIEKQVALSIDEKVAELTAVYADSGRKNEIQNGLRPALRQFLARIERGLTVDVRYLPPPGAKDEAIELSEEKEAKRAEIRAVASKLIFPPSVGEPILQIEAANDDIPPPRPTAK